MPRRALLCDLRIASEDAKFRLPETTYGVIPDTATLDAAALRRVKMPYADRFVPDTRKGGPEVK